MKLCHRGDIDYIFLSINILIRNIRRANSPIWHMGNTRKIAGVISMHDYTSHTKCHGIVLLQLWEMLRKSLICNIRRGNIRRVFYSKNIWKN